MRKGGPTNTARSGRSSGGFLMDCRQTDRQQQYEQGDRLQFAFARLFCVELLLFISVFPGSGQGENPPDRVEGAKS